MERMPYTTPLTGRTYPISDSVRRHTATILDGVAADFGEERRAYCLRMAAPHLQAGLCECRDNRLRITPKGLFVSDGIMADLLYVS